MERARGDVLKRAGGLDHGHLRIRQGAHQSALAVVTLEQPPAVPDPTVDEMKPHRRASLKLGTNPNVSRTDREEKPGVMNLLAPPDILPLYSPPRGAAMSNRALIPALLVLLAACSDGGTEPEPEPNPPAPWAVETDTAAFGETLIASAGVSMDWSASTSLSFGCARAVGATTPPTRSARVVSLLHDFGEFPFIVARFEPDVGSGGVGWSGVTDGRQAIAWDEVGDMVARRALGADSVRLTWAVGGTARDHWFDTRALDDAFATLTEVCGWMP